MASVHKRAVLLAGVGVGLGLAAATVWAQAGGTTHRLTRPGATVGVGRADATATGIKREKGEEAGVKKGSKVRASIRRIKGLDQEGIVRVPEYKTDQYRSNKKPGEWLEITTEYDTGDEWIDELTFSYYVLCRAREGRGIDYSLYKASVRYIDIAQDKQHYSTVFVRPNAVLRYGTPVAIAVVITVNGEVVDAKNESRVKLPEEWWSSPQVLENPNVKVTLREGYLLSRDQTPWALINTDDYETIKP